ncbi:ABC transporter permease [soil metagenome]
MRHFVLFLAFKHIRRRALQSVVTVVGVAVGVMVLITALSLTNGFIAELVRSTLQATPHLTLSALPGETLPFDEATLKNLEEQPGVVAVAPYLTTQALIFRRADASTDTSATQGYTQLFGINPDLERTVLPDLPQLTALADDEIILGHSLAYVQLGVFPGEEVQILNFLQQRRAFRVADTFRVGNELIDAVVAYTSIPALQSYLKKEGQISGYHIRVADPDAAAAVGRTLAAETGLVARSWEELFATLIEQLQLQKALISVVVFLIVLVAAMGIANLLILTVAEKTEEIAILRAMGASQRQILAVFVTECFVLGALGTVLGALLGFGISLYFKLKPFPLPGDLYFITQLPVEVQAWDILWVCGVSLLTSSVAGLLPARRASRLNPVDIIR